MDTGTDHALLRLLQLCSPALPVGAYAFSQGMEAAVESGWLPDAGTTRDWLALQLGESLARVDLPLVCRQWTAARAQDTAQLQLWNDYLLACRESAELRLAETAMGDALVKLLARLALPVPTVREPAFLTAFAVAAAHWQLSQQQACLGYAWTWLENQVMAATKLVPLGQGAAQQLLGELLDEVPAAVAAAEQVADDDIGASLPALAMASAWHETQYSRLFRS